MDASELIDVVAAVIERDGCILACRRAPGRLAAGFWEFPGGKVEPGETPAEALRREIAEELDVEIEVGEILNVNELHDAGIRLLCLRARLTGHEPTQSTDHDSIEWVPLRNLRHRKWAPADIPAVKALML